MRVQSGLIEAADAGRTVLVPNAELAAALFDAVERAERRAGREIWPTPRIRDFGGWLREAYASGQMTDSATPRCLSDAEEREVWRGAVLESDASGVFLDPTGAARAARRARRALHEYGMPLAAIARHATPESLAFLEWNERFARRLRELDCVSAEQLPTLVHPSPAAVLTWIESPSWRPVARRWLERHAGAPLRPQSATLGSGAPRVVRAASSAEELAAIAQWAGQHLDADAQFRAWICVPDLAARRGELTDAFDAVLAPQRFSLADADAGASYAIAGGTALADHAPVRAALGLLASSLGPVTFDEFSALLRSSELHASQAEASAAARLDLLLRGRGPSEATLGAWLELGAALVRAEPLPPVPALERLAHALHALQALSGTHPLSRWLPIWIGAFEAAPWHLRRRWSSGEYQAAERFRELLAALASGDAVFGSQSRHAAESIVRRAAHDTPFQTQTGIPPIWVSGERLDPWLTYEGLWVAGCTAERWPPPPEPLPLLPIRVQREYGVIGAALDTQRANAQELERRWQERASQCVLSYADEADGQRAIASPLLLTPATAAVAPPRPHWLAQWRHAPEFEQRIDVQAPPFGPDERTHGVATLKAQSRCAFRGFAESRLDACALQRPRPGFDERERGELLHEALRRIWLDVQSSSRLRALALDPEALARLVNDSVRQAVAARRRERDPGDRWCERERARLARLVQTWLELECERMPFEVEYIEHGAQIAHHAGLAFNVRIDRIDRLEDGSRVLIDYKSGAAAVDWRGERPDNPQLPVYALLHRQSLAAVAYARVNADGCRFVYEAQRVGIFAPRQQPSNLEGAASFAALIEVWSGRIEKLAADFAAGRAVVDPTLAACRSCGLQGLCRVRA